METQTVLIVESIFYSEISQALMEGARNKLEKTQAKIEKISVPGAFEIPAAVQFALDGKNRNELYNGFSGVIALGCIIQGETDHHDYINREITRALMNISTQCRIPLGFGVLTVKNYEQAMARANSKGDKDAGGKAALSCLRMIEISRQYSSLTI